MIVGGMAAKTYLRSKSSAQTVAVSKDESQGRWIGSLLKYRQGRKIPEALMYESPRR